jgi:cytochrome d ubiquinol oxidase subunit II
MATSTMAGIYPFWLRSTLDPSYSLTASNAASDRYGMGVALTWWIIGIALIACYFTYLFRSMRGKVEAGPGLSFESAGPGPIDSSQRGVGGYHG